MIINANALLQAAPIKNMLTTKERNHGVSHGLAEAGYDIRIKQSVEFRPEEKGGGAVYLDGLRRPGRFTIASAIEEFEMPENLVGVVHDKSTWARHGLSVFNTVLEPSWKGFLTLELVYHGTSSLYIPAGAGIAQILFSQIMVSGHYDGKYQNQEDRPVSAIMEGAQ